MDPAHLTTPAEAMEYLRSLPPDAPINLGATSGPIPPAYDAVRIIIGRSPYLWAARIGSWQPSVGEIIDKLNEEGWQ